MSTYKNKFERAVSAAIKGYESGMAAYTRLPKASNLNEVYENVLAASILGAANFSVHAFEEEPVAIEIPDTDLVA